MPFVSKAQQRWGNSAAGIAALGGPQRVAEWNASTSGKLPERVKVKPAPKAAQVAKVPKFKKPKFGSMAP